MYKLYRSNSLELSQMTWSEPQSITRAVNANFFHQWLNSSKYTDVNSVKKIPKKVKLIYGVVQYLLLYPKIHASWKSKRLENNCAID